MKSVDVKPLEDVGFEYGYNLNHLINHVAEYWLNKYSWKKQEKMLNDIMPQFVTQIDGLDIHFAHIKPDPKVAEGKTVYPLLIVHGWPGMSSRYIQIWPNIIGIHEFLDSSIFEKMWFLNTML